MSNNGLRLRVTHLHPANPAVADAITRKISKNQNEDDDLEDFISLPSEDEVRLLKIDIL